MPPGKAAEGITAPPIEQRHALRAGSHPAAHRDPFGRMLAAQAEIEGLTLVSADPELAAFDVVVIW